MSYIKDITPLIFKIILGIGALAAAILSIVAFLKKIKPFMKKRLNSKEKDMLARAVQNNNEILIISINGPPFVKIGTKHYGSNEDPSVNAESIEILERLINHGYVRQVDEKSFTLTKKGSDLGKKYQKKWRKE